MKIKAAAGALAVLVSTAGAALGAGPGRLVGAVTVWQKGQPSVVVCLMHSPYTCNQVRLYGGTRVVLASTGAPTTLARGEYVDVETRPLPEGPVATLVKVMPDQFVRAVAHYKKAQAPHIMAALSHVRGVTGVKLAPDLGEVLIRFNTRLATVAAIEHAARIKGVYLQLPG